MASLFPISLTTVHGGGDPNISTIHEDIIQNHILTRLDGPTLASAECASTQLRAFCNEGKLWREICKSMWPSVEDPRVRDVVSSFTGGHRKFFSDSFPLIDHSSYGKNHRKFFSDFPLIDHSSYGKNLYHPSLPEELIAAVDMHYRGKLIFSKVQQFETQTDRFLSATFRVKLLDPEEFVPIPIHQVLENESWQKHVEENLTLSWILIDSTRKRSMNLSSRQPVSVQRGGLTGDTEVRYTIVMGGEEGTSSEWVQCEIVVTLGGGKEGEGLQVRGVSLVLEGMEGRCVNGKESLVVLLGALENGRRRKQIANECKERYEGFVEWKRKRIQWNNRKHILELLFCIFIIILVFLSVWFDDQRSSPYVFYC